MAPALNGPLDLDLDLARVRSAREPVVVVGQISDRDGKRQRVGVLDVAPDGRGARVVADVWLDDPRALADELAAPLGAWDVLYATRWKYAWCAGRVWDRRGLRAKVWRPGLVDVRRTFGGMTRMSVIAVKARLDDGWLVRSVALVDGHSKEHVVARKRELSYVIDPVYDGIDLMFDAAWCPQMAKSLAQALEVECEIDSDLK